MHRGEVRRACDGASRQLHTKDTLATGTGALTENAESIMRQHALHHELPFLQFLPFDEISRRTLLGSPDDRHGLEILRADRGEKLLDGRARRGSAGERAAGLRAARGKYHYERDERALHGVSPSYL